MFTGLVQELGVLASAVNAGEGKRMGFRSKLEMANVSLGDSIAVDGVCLTVVEVQGDTWFGDVSHETLRCTTLGERTLGDPLHLEKALRMGDPLGGHWVQGHVDGVGTRISCKRVGGSWDLGFEVGADVAKYVVPRGSVTLDGVSLTVTWCENNRFGVTIIPHTSDATHLTGERVRVNVESDILGKYVVDTMHRMSGGDAGVTLDVLKKHGFVGGGSHD